jgi:hypothetical protein
MILTHAQSRAYEISTWLCGRHLGVHRRARTVFIGDALSACSVGHEEKLHVVLLDVHGVQV